MIHIEHFDADTERLRVHARNLAELDKARHDLAVQFETAAAASQADHVAGRSSDEIARLVQIAAALESIDHVAREELERLAGTLSEVSSSVSR